jgi:hypothetical protein
MIYQTLHRKQKIDQHEPHLKLWVNSCAPEGFLYKQFLLQVWHPWCYVNVKISFKEILHWIMLTLQTTIFGFTYIPGPPYGQLGSLFKDN